MAKTDVGSGTSPHWPAKGDVVRIAMWSGVTEPVKLVHIRHEAPMGLEAKVERWSAETIPSELKRATSRVNVLVAVRFEEGGDGGTPAIV